METENPMTTTTTEATNADLVEQYLAWMRDVRCRTPNTLDTYGTTLAAWLRWLGDKPLLEATVQDMEEFAIRPRPSSGRVAAPSTIAVEMSVLRSLYRWAWEKSLTPDFVARGLHAPNVPRRAPRPIPDEDWIRTWRSQVFPEEVTIFGLAYFCGLRRSELWNLRRDQLSTEGISNFRRKGGSTNTLAFDPILTIYERTPVLQPLLGEKGREKFLGGVSKLAEDERGIGWVCSIRLKSDNPRSLGWWWNKRRAGATRFTPHQARHSAATNLARAGVPPHLIAAIMNHSSIHTTMRYIRAAGADLEAWIEGLKEGA